MTVGSSEREKRQKGARQGRAFREFVRKQGEKGKVGQEPLGQGVLLMISQQRAHLGYRLGSTDSSVPGVRERQSQRNAGASDHRSLGPGSTRFSGQYSGPLPLTTSSPADSGPEALLDLPLVPVCV